MPLLLRNRDLLSHLRSISGVDVAISDGRVLVQGDQHSSEGVDDGGVRPGLVDGRIFLELGDADSDGEALVIKGAGPQQ